MRKSLIVLAALAVTGTALAAGPSVSEVYQAANSGNLAQAQQMMAQVLREHPRSGQAHYVEAELLARQGNLAAARQELSTAETLEPGLPFAKPVSVAELQRELSQSRPAGAIAATPARAFTVAPAARSTFPWGAILIIGGAIALFAFIFRRRRAPVAYSGGMPAAAGPGYGGGYGPGVGPMGGGGIGSGIAGGLASGLAVGAGVVAGEELARHFLDSDGRRVEVLPQDQSADPQQNADMGGSNFGVNDPNSWDDSSGGSFGGDFGGGGDSGGGGDWT